MKFGIISSLLIVAITVVIATLQGQRLGDLRDEETTLKKEAAELGVPLEGAVIAKSSGGENEPEKTGDSPVSEATVAVFNPSADQIAEAEAFTEELIAFALKMRAWQKAGEGPPANARQEMFVFLGRFLELDAEVLPLIIDNVRTTTKLEQEEKRNIVGFSFMMLSESSPEKALELYLASKDLVEGEERMEQRMVGQALSSFAAKDPAAAMAWLEQNKDKIPENAAEGAHKLAIGHSFRTNPELAVQMTLGLDRNELVEIAGGLRRVIPKLDEQLEILRNIEGDLDSLPSTVNELDSEALESASKQQLLRGGMLVGIGESLAEKGFSNASDFIDQANLTEVETAIIARGVAANTHDLNNHGEWLAWMQDHAAPDHREEATNKIVEQWTKDDFRATAAWITEQPKGELRDQATHTFAETVAPHEPDQAARWALTLPASNQRQALLQHIYQQWEPKDQEAASQFANEHGLTPNDPNPSEPGR